jgi:hypothetical protein
MFYGNAEDFRTYNVARGREVPDAWDDTLIDSALLVASEYIDANYENSFIGYKTNGFTQERSWPRSNAQINTYPHYIFDNDVIPEQVVKATYEAAYREVTERGSLSVDYKPNEYKSVSVDGAISVEYNSTSNASDVQKQIPAVEKLLQFLTVDGGSNNVSGKVFRT